MKKVFLLASTFFVMVSCSSDDAENQNIIPATELLDSFTNNNGYLISTFIEDGVDDTDDFNDYTFTFNTDNVVTASFGEESSTGFYLIFIDDGRTELRMNFPDNPQLRELNDDWYYVSQTENSFRFEDDLDIIEFQRL
jgi:hypothetical protein